MHSADSLLRFEQPRRATLLTALVEAEACAPLVGALLARLPALGPAALLAALEAEAAEPYRRLVARAHLALGEAAVDALLAPGSYELPPTSYHPPAAGPARGATRWEALLRRHATSVPGGSQAEPEPEPETETETEPEPELKPEPWP